MNIPKAVQLNTKVLTVFDYRLEEVEKKALKLGIEALKRVEDSRGLAPLYADILLPGETKD